MELSKILLSFLFVGHFTNAKETLVLPRITNKAEVIVGKSVQQALKTISSDFVIMNKKQFSKTSMEFGMNHPMATVGDFNQDGYRDIVVLGYSKSKRTYYVSAVISDNERSAYSAEVLMSYDINQFTLKDNPTYLKTISKVGNKALPREFLQIETYGNGGASAHSFYYSLKDKKFKIYQGTVD